MIIQGKTYWAKIVGPPQGGFDKSVLEWSMDVSLDQETVKKLEAEGLQSKIRNKGDDRGDFITFKRRAIKADGTKAKPIDIVDIHKNPWEDQKIGNGSVVDVMFIINDTEYGGKKFKKLGILKVRVVDLIPYEGKEYEDFEDVDNDGNETWGEEA